MRDQGKGKVMDYGNLLKRAWNIVWNNKYLLVLGLVVALTSGGSGSPGSGGDGWQPGQEERPTPSETPGGPSGFEDLEDLEGILPAWAGGALALGVGVVLALICVIGLIFLVVWAAGMIARGGLVFGVDEIETVGASTLGQAWGAGWGKAWRLIGIGLVPAIPGVVLAIMGLGLVGAAATSGVFNFSSEVFNPAGAGLIGTLALVGCLAALAWLALEILHTFAERAAMLEDKNVFESYSRGWEVLRAHLGQAVLLYLIQIGIGIAVAIVMIGPMVAATCCCILPAVVLGLALRTLSETYFSTAWTLAWREWAGGEPGVPVIVAREPELG
jgi:hypothetical protein